MIFSILIAGIYQQINGYFSWKQKDHIKRVSECNSDDKKESKRVMKGPIGEDFKREKPSQRQRNHPRINMKTSF